MVWTEVMSTELLQNCRTEFCELSIIPLSHTPTTCIQCTVDTIAWHSYEDVCGFCLWLNAHCARLPAAPWVPLTVFLFPMGELCGDDIQLLQNTVWFYSYALEIESYLILSIPMFSLPGAETTLTFPTNILPRLHCSRSTDSVTDNNLRADPGITDPSTHPTAAKCGGNGEPVDLAKC